MHYSSLALCVVLGSSLIAAQEGKVPLALTSSRVSIAGTSNVHPYAAATTTVRVTRVQLAADGTSWDDVLKSGALAAFEIAIPAASLLSGDGGLDKNMHKALKVVEHPDIVFRLNQIESRGDTPGRLRASGTLNVAGVERPIVLDLTSERRGAALVVRGTLPILMTDYGITPPKAMLGMLKTDPTVVVTVVATLALPELTP